MEHIKNKAILLSDGMDVTYPLTGFLEKLTLPSGNAKTYNFRGGCFVFIDEIGDVYAIPALSGVKGILVASDYTRDYSLEVPFSSAEAYPSEHKVKWLKMVAEMRTPI